MSIPHLDTRMIDGKKALLFGPFAGFSTKLLKYGAYTNLANSIEIDKIPDKSNTAISGRSIECAKRIVAYSQDGGLDAC